LALVLLAVWGQFARPLAAEPFDYRLMTPHHATSHSRCVGRVDTPLCALETYLAGRVRDLPILRDIALGKRRPEPGRTTYDAAPPFDARRTSCYRVTGSFLFRSGDVPPFNPWGARAGDVVIMTVSPGGYNRHCYSEIFPDTQKSWLFRRGVWGWFLVRADWRVDFAVNPYLMGWGD
jgi:hypothetical protein